MSKQKPKLPGKSAWMWECDDKLLDNTRPTRKELGRMCPYGLSKTVKAVRVCVVRRDELAAMVEELEQLRAALADCMNYVDCGNCKVETVKQEPKP